MCGQISCNFVIVLIFIGYSSKIAQMKHNLNGLHCKFWGLLKAIRGLFFLFYTKLGENMKLCKNLLNFSYGAKLAKWKIISGGIIVLRDMDHFETIRGRLRALDSKADFESFIVYLWFLVPLPICFNFVPPFFQFLLLQNWKGGGVQNSFLTGFNIYFNKHTLRQTTRN